MGHRLGCQVQEHKGAVIGLAEREPRRDFFWESATGSHVEVLKGETTFSSGGVMEFTCSKRFRMGAGIFGVPRPNLRTGSVKE